MLPDEGQETLARDALVRFVFAVLGKLPRESVEACREEAMHAAKYNSAETLQDLRAGHSRATA